MMCSKDEDCLPNFFCTMKNRCIPCSPICMDGEKPHPSEDCKRHCPDFQPPKHIDTSKHTSHVNQSGVAIQYATGDNHSTNQLPVIVGFVGLGLLVIILVIIIIILALMLYKERRKNKRFNAKSSVVENGSTRLNGVGNGTTVQEEQESESTELLDVRASGLGADIPEPSAPPSNEGHDDSEGMANAKTPAKEKEDTIVAQPENMSESEEYEANPQDPAVPVTQLGKQALMQQSETHEDVKVAHQESNLFNRNHAAAIPKRLSCDMDPYVASGN